MKKRSATALQGAIVLIGIGALAFLLWEPHVEGRNAHATVFQIYFNDPFLAYVYVGSIPLFVALYQAFTVLGSAGENRPYTPASARALRTMKYCAMAIIGFVAGGEVFILRGESDDRAGGVFMGVLITLGAVAIASAATVFERVLQNAVGTEPENDLTL